MNQTPHSPLRLRAHAGAISALFPLQRSLPLVFLIALLLLLAPGPGRAYQPEQASAQSAETYTVDRTDDPDPATASACTEAANDCSLRGAVARANASHPAAVTISLPPGVYTLTRAGRGEDGNSTGDLDLQANVTFAGDPANPASTIIQAGTNADNGIDRVMDINAAGNKLVNVTLRGLTVRYGYATDGYGSAVGFWGCSSPDGTLCNIGAGLGTFTLDRCIISDNTGAEGSFQGSAVEADQGTITITGSTITRNRTGSAGGAGLYSFSDTASLTITDSTISENRSESGHGGGISLNWSDGSVQIHQTEIISNTAGSRGGGASLSISGSATAVIQNSLISGNSSGGTGTSCAEGGGLYLIGDITITNSTFTNNNATAANGDNRGGGGIAVGGRGSVTVSNCRFYGNIAAAGPGVYANPGTGIHVDLNGGQVTAINNWWGCNGGPGQPGCQTAVVGGNGSYPESTWLHTDPWLILGFSASPTAIGNGKTSTLTADLTHNSAGAAGFSVPDGTPVTFAGTLGTANPASTTFTSGQATSTFTASSAGSGAGKVTVDGQTLSAAITIVQSPVVTAHPEDRTACAGASVSFSAAASGSPAPTVQWQVSTDNGASWSNVSGATSTTYTHTAQAAEDGYRYRAVFSNGDTATSNAAVLTVNSSPTVTTQPANQAVCAGASVSFSAAASGTPAPTVQWQVSTDGGSTWNDITGATAATYTHTALASESGNRYRAVFTNSCSTATSNAATLTINVAPVVSADPADQTACAGTSVSFSAVASGSPVPAVQWQVSTDNGSTWNNISGATSATYTHTALAAESGNRYRAVFTNSCGTATSDAATLTVNTAPTVTTQPADRTALAGTSVSFSAAASGSPASTVQWQVSTDGGSTWDNITGATAATYSHTALAAENGNRYRAVFTNSCGTATSDAATLTVDTIPAVTAQPEDRTACAGASVSFSAAASGDPAPTVQWQVSTDNGATWDDISGATSATYTHTALVAESGNRYRAMFTNSYGTATSDAATLTVNTPPAVTAQPEDRTVCAGASVSFNAAASGSPAPTVQWQVSTDGGTTWNDITGATAATYTHTALASEDGNRYRAVFTNGCSTATSDAATLTVNVSPAITTQPADRTVCAGASVSFSAAASGSPAPGVQWQVSTNGGSTWNDISGATSATYTHTALAPESGNRYRAVFTNTCSTATSAEATLTVNTSPTVTTHPADRTALAGTSVSFSAAASGSPAPGVQWQVSTNGGSTWSDISGATAATYTHTALATENGNRYRAVFTNSCSTATSDAATLAVTQAPAITGAQQATFQVGNAGSFLVIASGYPTPTLSASGALPEGVSFADRGDGTASLSGTPEVGSGGVYRLIFHAGNGVLPDASRPFTLTVNEAPAITSAGSVSFTAGTAGSFQVTAGGYPTPTLSASGALPDGVTFHDSGDGTATFSGTPAAGSGGAYPITLSARNGVLPDAGQSFTLNVATDADLSLTQHATPDPAIAGEVLTYTLTVTNHGPSQATGARLTDTVPAGATFLSASHGSYDAAGRQFTASLGNLASGAGVTVTVRLHVFPAARGALAHTAQVSADQPDPSMGNNTAHIETAIAPSAGLLLDVTDGQDTWYAAWNYQYTLVVTNTGPSDALGLLVTDTLPSQVSPVTLPAGALQNPDGSITWNLGSLGVGNVITLTLPVRSQSTARGALTNRALAACDGGWITATDTTTFVAAPAPSATPTATRTSTPPPSATPTATQTATATQTRTPTATGAPTVTPTASTTASATPTATGTSTPGDLTLSGIVYGEPEAPVGVEALAAAPIAGARVVAILCVPRTYESFSGSDGRYTLTIPAADASACETLDLEVSAAGYATQRQTFLVSDLRADPERDLPLAPQHTIRLPLILK